MRLSYTGNARSSGGGRAQFNPYSTGASSVNSNFGNDASGEQFQVAQQVAGQLQAVMRTGSMNGQKVTAAQEIGVMKDGVAYMFNMPEVKIYPNGKTSYDIHKAVQNSLDNLDGRNGLFWTNAAFTTEDAYNNFLHNHNTYNTTKGIEKEIYLSNGAARSARAAQFATASKVVKGLGLAGGALGTGTAYNNLYEGELSTRNYADAAIGTIGLMDAGAGYLVSGYSAPLVGQAVAIYSWEALWYDLGSSYGPSKWYGNDNSSWFK